MVPTCDDCHIHIEGNRSQSLLNQVNGSHNGIEYGFETAITESQSLLNQVNGSHRFVRDPKRDADKQSQSLLNQVNGSHKLALSHRKDGAIVAIPSKSGQWFPPKKGEVREVS